jgi:uncharacterized Ntn-hydrolase superfamily protein
MTFSILSHCPKSGQFGAAVSTSSIAVGARVPYVRTRIGGVLTQYRTDPRLGMRGLDLLESGCSAQEALSALVASSDRSEWRQLAVMDASGRTASSTGSRVKPHLGEVHGKNCVVVGNILANDHVLPSMVTAFEQSAGEHLAERMVRALEAAGAAGGEGKPVRSAALMVHAEQMFPLVNLRVDFADEALSAMRNLWNAYRPSIDDYVNRAVAPERIA